MPRFLLGVSQNLGSTPQVLFSPMPACAPSSNKPIVCAPFFGTTPLLYVRLGVCPKPGGPGARGPGGPGARGPGRCPRPSGSAEWTPPSGSPGRCRARRPGSGWGLPRRHRMETLCRWCGLGVGARGCKKETPRETQDSLFSGPSFGGQSPMYMVKRLCVCVCVYVCSCFFLFFPRVHG